MQREQHQYDPPFYVKLTYMKKFFTIFFVVLGVIFLILLLVGAYLFVFDPLHLRTPSDAQTTTPVTTATGKAAPVDKNPILSPTQEKTLETFGIDPATVPSSITPEQEACFTKILGATRVAEIKAGDSPTATEFFKAKSCI